MLIRAMAERLTNDRCRAGALPAAFAAIALAGLAAVASAQTPSIEFESRRKADPAPAAPVPSIDRRSLAAPVSGVDRVVIESFRFSGAQLIPPDTLAAELAAFTGRQLAADDLHQAALAIARLYLRQGNMARVRVASVSVAEGIAEIEIRELRVGRVRVELPDGTRITPDLVERFVTGGLAAGGPVPLARLEGGVATLNAQPGIAAAIAIDAALELKGNFLRTRAFLRHRWRQASDFALSGRDSHGACRRISASPPISQGSGAAMRAAISMTLTATAGIAAGARGWP